MLRLHETVIKMKIGKIKFLICTFQFAISNITGDILEAHVPSLWRHRRTASMDARACGTVQKVFTFVIARSGLAESLRRSNLLTLRDCFAPSVLAMTTGNCVSKNV